MSLTCKPSPQGWIEQSWYWLNQLLEFYIFTQNGSKFVDSVTDCSSELNINSFTYTWPSWRKLLLKGIKSNCTHRDNPPHQNHIQYLAKLEQYWVMCCCKTTQRNLSFSSFYYMRVLMSIASHKYNHKKHDQDYAFTTHSMTAVLSLLLNSLMILGVWKGSWGGGGGGVACMCIFFSYSPTLHVQSYHSNCVPSTHSMKATTKKRKKKEKVIVSLTSCKYRQPCIIYTFLSTYTLLF